MSFITPRIWQADSHGTRPGCMNCIILCIIALISAYGIAISSKRVPLCIKEISLLVILYNVCFKMIFLDIYWTVIFSSIWSIENNTLNFILNHLVLVLTFFFPISAHSWHFRFFNCDGDNIQVLGWTPRCICDIKQRKVASWKEMYHNLDVNTYFMFKVILIESRKITMWTYYVIDVSCSTYMWTIRGHS